MEIGKAIVAILLFETLLIITTNCRVRTFRMFNQQCDDEMLSKKRADIYALVNILVVISIFPISLSLMGLFAEELPLTGNPVFDFIHSLSWIPLLIELWFIFFKIWPKTKMMVGREKSVHILNLLYPVFLMIEVNLILYSYQTLFEKVWLIGALLLILTSVEAILITRSLAKLKFFRWPESYNEMPLPVSVMRLTKMNKVTRDDYVFNVDLEKSEVFYCDRPIIFPGLSSYLPELTTFLNTLGIDIEKPVKYRYHDSSDLVYRVFGLVEVSGKYELDIHDNDKFASIVFYKKKDEDGLYLEIFNLVFQQPKLSYFEKSDGWLLYSLSTRFSDLNTILSAGDHYNHAVFTYKELNGGLLRHIQNGYAEVSNRKFRITKKGKALIRRLSFPQWFLGSSTDAMLTVHDKIVSILTEVEVDYSVDAISNEEYQEAVRKHSLLFENWLKSRK